MSQRRYAAKLLLFGEYCVINGSPAMSIPISVFSGSFIKAPYDWTDFIAFILGLNLNQYPISLQKEQLLHDIQEGVTFESNIPQGYGLGSSAAVTAAFFDTYFVANDKLSLDQLKNILATIEGFFHGTSSGLDPLVSYLNQPMLIHKDGKIEISEFDLQGSDISFFLYDSQRARNTKMLVENYKERYQESPQYRTDIQQLSQLNQEAIDGITSKDFAKLTRAFSQISQLESELFSDMIPSDMKGDFQKLGLKLCGAGGGGFFLGLGKTDEVAKCKSTYPITII